MTVPKWISPLFWVAAVYDGVLGLLFLAAPLWVFQRFEVPPPNHVGYLQCPAALLIIFGLMFVAIARDPLRNRGLIVPAGTSARSAGNNRSTDVRRRRCLRSRR